MTPEGDRELFYRATSEPEVGGTTSAAWWSLAHHQALMSLIADIVWETDAVGRLSFLSPSVVEALGTVPAERIGRRFDDVFHPVPWEIGTVCGTGLGPPDAPQIRILYSETGAPVYVRTSGRRLRDPQTLAPIGMVGTACYRDQADLRRMAARSIADTLQRGLLPVLLMDGKGRMTAPGCTGPARRGPSDRPGLADDVAAFWSPHGSAGPQAGWHALPATAETRHLAAPRSVLVGPPCGQEGDHLVITVDEGVLRVFQGVGQSRNAQDAAAVARRFADGLVEGAADLWAEVRAELAPRGLADVLTGEADRITAPRSGDDPTLNSLTDRQRDVLDLLAEGHTNKEIGRQLGISAATVKSHIRGLRTTLGVSNRTSAAAFVSRVRSVDQGSHRTAE